MKIILFWFIYGVTHTGIAHAGETCTDYDRRNVYFYCETGCCKSWPYEECCPETAWLGWAIAGGVIGGLLLISLIICVVCMCLKQKGKTGRVIQPHQATTVAYIPAYPHNQVYYPQYVTTGFAPDPSARPPAYQSLHEQQPTPPLPSGLHGRQQQSEQGQQPLNRQKLPPIGFEGR